MALAYFGMSGALANATGLLLGGVFGIVSAEGQLASWRWFFRFVTAVRYVVYHPEVFSPR